MAFFKEELSKIKAFVFDVDGVLSHNVLTLSPEGDPAAYGQHERRLCHYVCDPLGLPDRYHHRRQDTGYEGKARQTGNYPDIHGDFGQSAVPFGLPGQ